MACTPVSPNRIGKPRVYQLAQRPYDESKLVALTMKCMNYELSSTIRHRVFHDSQKNEARILSLPQLDGFASVQYFCTRFGCTVQALTDISQSRNRKEAAEARLPSFDIRKRRRFASTRPSTSITLSSMRVRALQWNCSAPVCECMRIRCVNDCGTVYIVF